MMINNYPPYIIIPSMTERPIEQRPTRHSLMVLVSEVAFIALFVSCKLEATSLFLFFHQFELIA